MNASDFGVSTSQEADSICHDEPTTFRKRKRPELLSQAGHSESVQHGNKKRESNKLEHTVTTIPTEGDTTETNTQDKKKEKANADSIGRKVLKKNSENNAGKHLPFPEKLMKLLEKEDVKECIWWLWDGTAFAIEPKAFTGKILNSIFQGNKLQSFIRTLRHWGFKRVPNHLSGEFAFYHPLFRKNSPHLLEELICAKERGNIAPLKEPTSADPPRTPEHHHEGQDCVTRQAASLNQTRGLTLQQIQSRMNIENLALDLAYQQQQSRLFYALQQRRSLLNSLELHRRSGLVGAGHLGQQRSEVGMQALSVFSDAKNEMVRMALLRAMSDPNP